MSDERTSYQIAQELATAQLLAFEQASKEEPHNFKPVFGAGLMLQRLGKHAEAVAALSRVLEMKPGIAEAHYSRALSQRAQDRDDEALHDLETALKLRPDYVDAQYALGVTLKKLERFDEAMEAFTRVIQQAGVYPEASHGRATIRSRLGDNAGAIKDFTVCIEHGLDGYDIRLLRGLALHRLDRNTEALDDLTRAIAFRPADGSTYLRRWQVYKALGDDVHAAEDLRLASELMVNHRAAGHIVSGQLDDTSKRATSG